MEEVQEKNEVAEALMEKAPSATLDLHLYCKNRGVEKQQLYHQANESYYSGLRDI